MLASSRKIKNQRIHRPTMIAKRVFDLFLTVIILIIVLPFFSTYCFNH